MQSYLKRWSKKVQFKTAFVLTELQFVTDDMTKINDMKFEKKYKLLYQ